MTVKIWRLREQERGCFVRFFIAVVGICDEDGELVSGGHLLCLDGTLPVDVNTSAASEAGVILDSEGRWDKDQCIEVLTQELARRQRDE